MTGVLVEEECTQQCCMQAARQTFSIYEMEVECALYMSYIVQRLGMGRDVIYGREKFLGQTSAFGSNGKVFVVLKMKGKCWV